MEEARPTEQLQCERDTNRGHLPHPPQGRSGMEPATQVVVLKQNPSGDASVRGPPLYPLSPNSQAAHHDFYGCASGDGSLGVGGMLCALISVLLPRRALRLGAHQPVARASQSCQDSQAAVPSHGAGPPLLGLMSGMAPGPRPRRMCSRADMNRVDWWRMHKNVRVPSRDQ